MKLLKSQTNKLFDLIVQYGFSPLQFVIGDYQHPSYILPSKRIRHNSSDYYFLINGYSTGIIEKYYYDFSPSLIGVREFGELEDWESITTSFEEWLIALAAEIELIDKWQQLTTEMPDFKIIPINSQGKFSYEEVEQITNKMPLLKARIKEIPLTEAQEKAINGRLEELLELSKTSTKTNWEALFIGSIMSLMLTLAITPDNVRLIWEAVKIVFSNFLLN